MYLCTRTFGGGFFLQLGSLEVGRNPFVLTTPRDNMLNDICDNAAISLVATTSDQETKPLLNGVSFPGLVL